MAKQGRAKKHDKLGTGKVTPMQIAFIVDRYLSINNYSATLSSFRSEASDLLSRTQGKEGPRGLMGLAEILDDYIRIKEQRLVIDREKQRVDAAIHGLKEVMRVYETETVGSVSAILSTSPTQITASTTVPLFSAPNPIDGSHSSHAMRGISIMNNSKPPLLPPKAAGVKCTAPTHSQSSTEKRKTKRCDAKEPPPKKLHSHSPSTSNAVQGHGLRSQEACPSNVDHNTESCSVLPISDGNSAIQPPVQGLSVVKTLFKYPEGSQLNTSSPKTPPQELTSQMDKSVSPIENSAFTAADAGSFQKITPSSCSVLSSETIIISPLKNTSYYSVERSYQVTCSPMKTCAMRLGKREHVKGRLDFDKSDAFESSEKPCTVEALTSSPSDCETSEGFDFDLPDFEMFDGDFLSGLLVDIDEHEGFSAYQSANTNIIQGSEQCADGENPGANQNLCNSSISKEAGSNSECTGLQGYTSNLENVVMV